MSKLYVFAIGGTGARVLKSLTMLLAAGVKVDVEEIIPIIIDPDAGCGDKTDTIRLMDQYIEIYNTQNHSDNRKIKGFTTKIGKLDFPRPYEMPMGSGTNTDFGTYMDFGSLTDSSRALINMLFSEENQKADMTIGFTGNPNIGSVVLNQFANTPEFQTFAANFALDDKIFIISSIFGGTGASGFPLLLKNLRNISPDLRIANAAAIQNAEIGALTVLPYFNIAPKDDSVIDSDTFVSKAKAALSYYEKNLTGLNYLYYIGDNAKGIQENNEGGDSQRNEAHFIELASALAVIDFANSQNPTGPDGPVTIYKEFGIERDSNDITLKELDTFTYLQVAGPLTTFTLFAKFYQEHLRASLSQTWIKEFYPGLVGGLFDNTIKLFTESYMRWLRELESGKHARRFTPFYLDERPGDVFSLVKGIKPSKVFMVSASNWDLVNHYLNKSDTATQANRHSVDLNGRYISRLLYGIQQVVSDKIKL